jgi:hypothetical protein
MRSTLLALVACCGAAAQADVVNLTPVADASIYLDDAGMLANGAGAGLFAGNNGFGEPRRCMIRFDLSSIPAGSTVTAATLTLHLSMTQPGSPTMEIRRCLTSWNEGPSVALGGGGAGAPAQAGDSTWLHTFYNTQFWQTAGGDFAASPSATMVVGDVLTFYSASSAGLVADVQGWLTSPAANFGWFILGDEANFATAKRFDSREATNASFRPVLQVTFTPPAGGCYANCDGSTTPPILNVLDFSCFLNKFAAGNTYANCDGSTTPPILNVLDFSCFLNKFAAGCP